MIRSSLESEIYILQASFEGHQLETGPGSGQAVRRKQRFDRDDSAGGHYYSNRN